MLNWAGDGITNFNLRKTTTENNFQNDFYVKGSARDELLDTGQGAGESMWWSGHVMQFESHGVNLGQICSYNGSTNGWEAVDWNNAKGTRLLGVAVGEGEILLDGHVFLTNTSGTYGNMVSCPNMNTADMGQPIYGAQGVTGGTSLTAPNASGQYVRILGHAYSRDTTNEEVYLFFFRPSNDWVLI